MGPSAVRVANLNGRVASIGVTGTERHREGDPAVVGQATAFDDFVAQALAFDDCGEAAGSAERGFAMIGGSPTNLEAHD
jgi:hypothetical protein